MCNSRNLPLPGGEEGRGGRGGDIFLGELRTHGPITFGFFFSISISHHFGSTPALLLLPSFRFPVRCHVFSRPQSCFHIIVKEVCGSIEVCMGCTLRSITFAYHSEGNMVLERGVHGVHTSINHGCIILKTKCVVRSKCAWGAHFNQLCFHIILIFVVGGWRDLHGDE